MTTAESQEAALKRVAIAGGMVGVLAASAWFLPMRGQGAFAGESITDFALHVGFVIFISAATLAFLTYWSALMSLRLGPHVLTGAAALVGVLAILYPRWQKEGALSTSTWIEAACWGAGTALYVFVIGVATSRLAERGT